MSLYLTKDDLYDDMREDFNTLVNYTQQLDAFIDSADLWDVYEVYLDSL